jgi:glycosyltransferase involved in cell wall biosynthesis
MPAPSVTRIDPLPTGLARPLWSVMIPTYNCANYLTQALETVLAQDPGPEQMQIEVVDDCSFLDDPAAVVERLGRGRVAFHRNDPNLGMFRNFNACLARSRGHLVHVLNGDDYVGRDFYQKMGDAFQQSPECDAVFSRSFIVHSNRKALRSSEFCRSLTTVTNDPRELMMRNPLRTPGVAVRRSFYEREGGFDTRFAHIGDWDMWVRAIVQGGARMLDEPLAYYRVHEQNDTNRVTRLAVGLHDQLKLSAKWQVEGLKNFDRSAFDWQTARIAAVRAFLFALRGDREAAEANWRVWSDHAAIKDIPRACFDTLLSVGSRVACRAREALRDESR